MRKGFTLIEVMVAVMIVSIVIAALLKVQGNSSNKLIQLQKMMKTTQYSSFLLANSQKYGFESTTTNMADILDDFKLEDSLRRKLKTIKIDISYDQLDTLDSSDFSNDDQTAQDQTIQDDTNDAQQGQNLILEIGKTVLKSDKFTNSLVRVQVL